MNEIIDLQNYITNTAKKNGALVVGYTKIRQTEPVIVIGFPFSNKWILNHPFYITKRFGEEVWISWKLLQTIAETLHGQGYSADFKTPLSVFGDFRPLAISAGLGNWGKNGLVVNSQYGSKLLFAAVFTDAPFDSSLQSNLLTHSGQNQGHTCDNCSFCIMACPGRAFEGNRFHKIRCFSKSIRGCSECVQVCPSHYN